MVTATVSRTFSLTETSGRVSSTRPSSVDGATLPLMGTRDASQTGPPALSLTEWVVLAVLVEAPVHGFAIAKELRPNTDLGRILTVHRPLVYRALDRLVAAALAEPHHSEPGEAGPTRTVHRPTASGRSAVDAWLDRPVARVRELRIEFLAKLRLNQRRDRDLSHLVNAQRSALAETFARLEEPSGGDVVDRWRSHNAHAARAFLEDLSKL